MQLTQASSTASTFFARQAKMLLGFDELSATSPAKVALTSGPRSLIVLESLTITKLHVLSAYQDQKNVVVLLTIHGGVSYQLIEQEVWQLGIEVLEQQRSDELKIT